MGKLLGRMAAFGFVAATCMPEAHAQSDPWEGGNWTADACDIFEASPNCKGRFGKRRFATQVEVMIPKTGIRAGSRDPQCGTEMSRNFDDYIPDITEAFIAYYSGDRERLYNKAGSITKAVASDAAREVRKTIRGDAGRWLERNLIRKTDKAACRVIDVVVPKEAEVVGYRFVRVMGERNNSYITCSRSHVSKDRDPTADCSWARFDHEPIERIENGVRIYYTTFANWSDNQNMYGRMIIFYDMPPGKKPEHPPGM